MVPDNLLAKTSAVNMSIYFGGGDALVTEHCLYHTQVGTALKQMGGKGVTERVGAYILLYPGRRDKLFYEMEYHDARQGLLQPLADEYEILIARLYGYTVPVTEIGLEFGYRTPRDRDKALLVTLSGDTDELFGKVEVGHAQGTELRHAQATTVEYLNHGAVALSFVLGEVYLIDYVINLLHREHIGKVHADLRRLEQLRRIISNEAVKLEETIEGTQ